jgi:hypothetical protein
MLLISAMKVHDEHIDTVIMAAVTIVRPIMTCSGPV